MKISVIGLNLAKNVFRVPGVDEHGKAVLTKRLARTQMAKFFATLPPCLIGMEACGSAHHWARKFRPISMPCGLSRPNSSALRQIEQERPQRCRGDLRGRFLPAHAIRAP